MSTDERAQIIFDSAEVEHAHKAASVQGISEVPDAEADPGNAYLAFTAIPPTDIERTSDKSKTVTSGTSQNDNGHGSKSDSEVYEMAGYYKGPLPLGIALDETKGEDLLNEKVLQLLRKYIQSESDGDKAVNFSLLALVRNTD
jgi:hypothetical protein